MCGFRAVQSENEAVFAEGPASQRDNWRALCEESEARVSSPGRGSSWPYGVIRAAGTARMAANASTVTTCQEPFPELRISPMSQARHLRPGEAG